MKHIRIVNSLCVIAVCAMMFSCTSVDSAKNSDWAIVYSKRHHSQKKLEKMADKAIRLYQMDKVHGVILAVPDEDGDYIHTMFTSSDVEIPVSLNLEPDGFFKTKRDIGDVMGYRNSYIFIAGSGLVFRIR